MEAKADSCSTDQVIGNAIAIDQAPPDRPHVSHYLGSKSILTYVPLAMLIVNDQCTIVEANFKAEKLLGYPTDEIIGKCLFDLTGETAVEAKNKLAALEAGEIDSLEVEKNYRKKDGETIVGRTTCSKIQTAAGKTPYRIILIQDISRERELEKQKEAEEHFRKKLSDTSPSMVYIYDFSEKKCVYANEFVHHISGLKANELVGMPSSKQGEFMHPLDSETIRRFHKNLRSAKDNEVIESEYRFAHQSGEWRWLKVRASVFERDSNGTVVQFIGSGVDITVQKRIEKALIQSESQFRILAKHSFTGIFLADQEGKAIYTNEKISEIVGRSFEEMLGEEWTNGLHPDDKDRVYREWMKAVENNTVFESEIKWVQPNGKVVSTWVYATPVRDQSGRVTSFVGNIIDLTERKKAERTLSQKAKLERLNHELKQFAYIASHDLQEPLRTIISFTSLLEQGNMDNLTEDGKAQMTFISKAADRMSKLIEGILSYSRIGAIRTVEPVDCTEILTEVLRDMNLPEEVMVIYGELPVINSAKSELRTLFQNLISNAVKFHHVDVDPRVEISAEEEMDGWTFSIKDNGIGIEPKYQEKIFEIFQRLHLKSEFDGTGIGLSNCKRVVDIHGGKIWVESVFGRGATFKFYLPNN